MRRNSSFKANEWEIHLTIGINEEDSIEGSKILMMSKAITQIMSLTQIWIARFQNVIIAMKLRHIMQSRPVSRNGNSYILDFEIVVRSSNKQNRAWIFLLLVTRSGNNFCFGKQFLYWETLPNRGTIHHYLL